MQLNTIYDVVHIGRLVPNVSTIHEYLNLDYVLLFKTFNDEDSIYHGHVNMEVIKMDDVTPFRGQYREANQHVLKEEPLILNSFLEICYKKKENGFEIIAYLKKQNIISSNNKIKERHNLKLLILKYNEVVEYHNMPNLVLGPEVQAEIDYLQAQEENYKLLNFLNKLTSIVEVFSLEERNKFMKEFEKEYKRASSRTNLAFQKHLHHTITLRHKRHVIK